MSEPLIEKLFLISVHLSSAQTETDGQASAAISVLASSSATLQLKQLKDIKETESHSDGLQPTSNGLQPTSVLAPSSDARSP